MKLQYLLSYARGPQSSTFKKYINSEVMSLWVDLSSLLQTCLRIILRENSKNTNHIFLK